MVTISVRTICELTVRTVSVVLGLLSLWVLWTDPPRFLVSTERLVRRLGSQDKERRTAAESELKERYLDAVPALRRGLGSHDAGVRYGALDLLAQFPSQLRAEDLVDLVVDQDRRVGDRARSELVDREKHLARVTELVLLGWARAEAIARVETLRQLQTSALFLPTVPAETRTALLGVAVQDAAEQVRLEAVKLAMGDSRRTDFPRPVPELIPLLDDPSPAVRARAVEAVGQCGIKGRPHVARLVELATDPDPCVRAAALAAGARIGWPEQEALRLLVAGLRSPAEETRLAAVGRMALLEICEPELVPQLHEVLQTCSPRYRGQVAVVLGACGAHAALAVDELVGMLAGDDGGSGQGAGGSAQTQLGAGLRGDEVLWSRQAVATALGRIGAWSGSLHRFLRLSTTQVERARRV